MGGNIILKRGGVGAIIATFLGLTDTPGAYAGEGGKFVKVNATPDALIFATIAWGDVSKAGSNLTDLATRAHAGLSDAPSDAHHAASHTLVSHSTRPHSALTDAPADAHHPQSHSLASHSSKAHSELSDAPTGAHHAQVHTLASHTSKDHHLLAGLGDDDHTIYYNSIRHTKAIHDALLITTLGSGALAKDHGAAATDMLVNVCYGTTTPPAAGGTTIGTLFVKYTA